MVMHVRIETFSGKVGTAPKDDLWELDLTNLAWSEVIAQGANPSARHSMGFAAASGANILLFGGQTHTGIRVYL
jgi:hypothetical protein